MPEIHVKQEWKKIRIHKMTQKGRQKIKTKAFRKFLWFSFKISKIRRDFFLIWCFYLISMPDIWWFCLSGIRSFSCSCAWYLMIVPVPGICACACSCAFAWYLMVLPVPEKRGKKSFEKKKFNILINFYHVFLFSSEKIWQLFFSLRQIFEN